jgi:hypothetical protein
MAEPNTDPKPNNTDPKPSDSKPTTTQEPTKLDPPDGYTPPETQAEFDRIIADRLKREREKFADYGDLKRKAGEYDKVVEAQKTAEQKATDAANAAEKRAQEALERVARAEVKAALTGIVDSPDDIADDLNISRFLTDNGEVDGDKVAALKAKYEALRPPERRSPAPNPAQGANGSKPPTRQLTRDALKGMSPEDIAKADEDGLLGSVLSGTNS